MSTPDHNRALVIGVGQDLPGTVADAEGIAGYLRDPARCGYHRDNVVLLAERDAGRDRVLRELDALAAAPEDATVLVYFSGHGMVVEGDDGPVHYLMTNGYDLRRRARTCVKGREFAERLARIPARRLLLLLDCCHAGGVVSDRTKDLPAVKSVAIPPEVREAFGQGRGRWVIASCRDDETSLAGSPYSLFTRAVLQALCGQGNARNDGFVRVLDIALHCREKVPQWAEKVVIRGERQSQHPIADIDRPADNFVVAYYAAERAKKGDFTPLPDALPDPDAAQEVEANAGRRPGTQVINSGNTVSANIGDVQGSTIIIAGGNAGAPPGGARPSPTD